MGELSINNLTLLCIFCWFKKWKMNLNTWSLCFFKWKLSQLKWKKEMLLHSIPHADLIIDLEQQLRFVKNNQRRSSFRSSTQMFFQSVSCSTRVAVQILQKSPVIGAAPGWDVLLQSVKIKLTTPCQLWTNPLLRAGLDKRGERGKKREKEREREHLS